MTTFDIAYSSYAGFIVLALMCAFISLFTHSWTRGGYSRSPGEPTNDNLETHEVSLFVAHVAIAIGIISLVAVIMAEPMVIKYYGVGFGTDSKLVLLAIAGGPGAYVAFKKIKTEIQK